MKTMRRLIACFVVVSLSAATARAPKVPTEIWGTWKIVRTLPTRTISCWGDKEAKSIIGTEIEYTPTSFRWKRFTIRDPKVTERVVSPEQYPAENSGQGSNRPYLPLPHLRTPLPEPVLISLHPPP